MLSGYTGPISGDRHTLPTAVSVGPAGMLTLCVPSTHVCAQPAFHNAGSRNETLSQWPRRVPFASIHRAGCVLRKTYNLSSPKALADRVGREEMGGGAEAEIC